MDDLSIFGVQFIMSLFVYGLLARWFAVPWLAGMTRRDALIILLLPHAFRHIGLTFFVPGVVAQPLPELFASTAAYGDLLAAVLAILSMIALRARWFFALALVWIFNLAGTVDLLNALRQAEAVPDLGGTWYIPTFFVPLLLVTHFLIFARVLKRD